MQWNAVLCCAENPTRPTSNCSVPVPIIDYHFSHLLMPARDPPSRAFRTDQQSQSRYHTITLRSRLLATITAATISADFSFGHGSLHK